MINAIKKWWKMRRIISRLNSELFVAINCNWWGRAWNICDRISRTKGKHTTYLADYQRGKRGFVASTGFLGEWQFDPYSLS